MMSENFGNKRLRVSEIFGPTIQGEGVLIGVPTHFVRLGGCDFRCGWCDTPHAVLTEHRGEWKLTAVDDIIDRLNELGRTHWVTLSGGNPCSQDCSFLVMRLHMIGIKVAVETQGSLAPNWLADVDRLTISPKPPSAKLTPKQIAAQVETVLACIGNGPGLPRTSFKFVIDDEADLNFAEDFCDVIGFMGKIFVQPCNRAQIGAMQPNATALDLLAKMRWLTDNVLARKSANRFVVLPQLHVLMYGDERGR